MEISVEPSKTYAVTTSGSCTVTDADGLELCTASSGSQAFFVATTPTVTISDDGAKVSRATFNYALAVAGLLGGGDKLPAGYTRLEFLESTGTQWLRISRSLTIADDCVFTYKGQNTGGEQWQHAFGVRVAANTKEFGISYNTLGPNIRPCLGAGFASIATDITAVHELKVSAQTGTAVLNGVSYNVTMAPTSFDRFGVFGREGVAGSYFVGRIFEVSLFNAGQQILKFIPALAPTGQPCMYDMVTRTPYERSGSGQFVAGFTLAQARRLGKLPAGTTLTVSLPVGYDSDAGVVDALGKAEANGCVLTVQTYESASAAATFALRRIWVKRTQDADGTYVDADNTRWQIEWCVDVIGADPESLGYERFRSVDAATEYWGLVPYAYPEEELSTDE